jgi:hypothetical protein
MAWPKKSRLRRCPSCGKRFNLIDWANHRGMHLSPEERELRVRRMIEEKKRNEKPLPPDEVVFRGFRTEDE